MFPGQPLNNFESSIKKKKLKCFQDAVFVCGSAWMSLCERNWRNLFCGVMLFFYGILWKQRPVLMLPQSNLQSPSGLAQRHDCDLSEGVGTNQPTLLHIWQNGKTQAGESACVYWQKGRSHNYFIVNIKYFCHYVESLQTQDLQK